MTPIDSNDIILCVNCDAEYAVMKYDDDAQDPEFCPFCGYHLLDDRGVEDEEYDD